MKKIIVLMGILVMTGLLSGCEKQEAEPVVEEKRLELEELSEVDFAYDYTEDIRGDIDAVVASATSIQEELENVNKVTEKYTLLSESALTQGEMNVSSYWFYMIWDTELNHLWSRFSELADEETKDKLLEEQRNWIAMKDEVTLLSLGTREENGSMYPLLVNSLWEEKTQRRSYVIANELCKITGEAFSLPKVSDTYGLFVDCQGTDSIYSYLLTREGWEGNEEAVISVYRQGMLEGSFVDNGNGNLSFLSNDGTVKGTIVIDGWKGASFEITEAAGECAFSAGEKFEFPFVF